MTFLTATYTAPYLLKILTLTHATLSSFHFLDIFLLPGRNQLILSARFHQSTLQLSLLKVFLTTIPSQQQHVTAEEEISMKKRVSQIGIISANIGNITVMQAVAQESMEISMLV